MVEYWFYSQLPRLLRQVIRYGPYDYGIERVWHRWQAAKRRGRTLREFARQEQRKQRWDMRREIIAAYGPDHPQIRRRRK